MSSARGRFPRGGHSTPVSGGWPYLLRTTPCRGDFEGIRAGHAHGTGAVIVWDEGTAEVTPRRARPPVCPAARRLTRTAGNRWILVKTRDNRAQPRLRHRDRAARQRPLNPAAALAVHLARKQMAHGWHLSERLLGAQIAACPCAGRF
jgi:hypothetical protein